MSSGTDFRSPYKYKAELERNQKLNPGFKAEWVKALLSGNYKQAKKTLCRVDRNADKRFCCLGVASDMYKDKFSSEEYPIKWDHVIFGDSEFLELKTPKASADNMPPNEVIEWAYGVPSTMRVRDQWCIYVDEKDAKRFLPNDYPYRNYVHLPELNDRGVSFKTIAYLVDKYL